MRNASRYHKAVKTIKANGEYDKLSWIHTRSMSSPAAHGGPGFLGWHREFIKRYEIALRTVDHKAALPYWDNTLDERLHYKKDSILWSEKMMGEADDQGYVVRSPFGQWQTTDVCVFRMDVLFIRMNLGYQYFTRHIGRNRGYLMTEEDVQTIIENTPSYQHIFAYTAASRECYNPGFWTALEYVHGLPHMYVGGHMARITASTNDPLFWMHHSFVDLIWEQWRQKHQKKEERETQFPYDEPECSSQAHFMNSTMVPWSGMRIIDGLSNNYTEYLYEYAPRPTCSRSNLNGCNSTYLFCDLSNGEPHCASKIKLGGYCDQYIHNEDRCYNGTCIGGTCVAKPGI
ncbi:common central domain of tyrosinase [Ancylostoma caninum]|uniref:Common central domain of tyrosinase n=1 Tax=Ancylostoma caninum TaxID=29170 RepID=A0A368GT33_ANCCA|nr:common central domain of tyrosinase [Ancylostoma caninum]